MSIKLATLLLLLVTVTLSSSFSWSNADFHTPNSKPKTSNLTFTDFKLLSANERNVRQPSFPDNPKKIIRFRQLTSIIKNDTSAVIHVIIDNGEREREFTAVCTAYDDSVVLSIKIPDWYRNFEKTYTAKIPL